MIKKDVSTVLTSSGYGAITPIAPAKVYRTRAGRDGRPQAAPGINNYDSVTLSAPSQGSRFHMGLVSRLSQEVRTATTTGTVNALREQVQAGTYKVDAGAIARKMLLLGEV